MTSMMRAISSNLGVTLTSEEVFATYELHYYVAIRAWRLGFLRCELLVTREYPADGKVPTKNSGWRGNVNILKVIGKVCLGKYDREE